MTHPDRVLGKPARDRYCVEGGFSVGVNGLETDFVIFETMMSSNMGSNYEPELIGILLL